MNPPAHDPTPSICGSPAWSTPCPGASPKPKPRRSRISSFSNCSSRTSSPDAPIASSRAALKQAGITVVKTLADFDWTFNAEDPQDEDRRIGQRALRPHARRRAAHRPARRRQIAHRHRDRRRRDSRRPPRARAQHLRSRRRLRRRPTRPARAASSCSSSRASTCSCSKTSA